VVVSVLEALLGEEGASMLIGEFYETGNFRQISERDEGVVLDFGRWLVDARFLDADALF